MDVEVVVAQSEVVLCSCLEGLTKTTNNLRLRTHI
jgi:hypothetical protein